MCFGAPGLWGRAREQAHCSFSIGRMRLLPTLITALRFNLYALISTLADSLPSCGWALNHRPIKPRGSMSTGKSSSPSAPHLRAGCDLRTADPMISRATRGSPSWRASAVETKLLRSWRSSPLLNWFAYVLGGNWAGLEVTARLPLHLWRFQRHRAPLALLDAQQMVQSDPLFRSFTLTLQRSFKPMLALARRIVRSAGRSWAGHRSSCERGLRWSRMDFSDRLGVTWGGWP